MRRQHPVEGFTVDFAWPAARIAIEIDGESHEASGERDARRDRLLSAAGWRTFRFAAASVLSSPEEAFFSIHALLREVSEEGAS